MKSAAEKAANVFHFISPMNFRSQDAKTAVGRSDSSGFATSAASFGKRGGGSCPWVRCRDMKQLRGGGKRLGQQQPLPQNGFRRDGRRGLGERAAPGLRAALCGACVLRWAHWRCACA